jgi:hypothetical protein
MTRLAIAALCAGVLFAACGGDGGGSPTRAGLETAARRQAEAFLKKDWRAAYNAFTKECRESISYSEFAAQMTFAMALVEGFSGTKWEDFRIDTVEVRDFSDGEGDVRVRLVDPEGEEFSGEDDLSHWVFEDGQWRNSDCGGLEGDGGFTDEEEEPATGPGSSRDEPAPIGTSVRVAGWDVTVTDVEPDATRRVLEESEFNDPPPAGQQFFLVTISATYNGDEESSAFFFDVTLKALGPSNVAYDYEADCGLIPDELPDTRDVFQGGTISGNVCWSVRSEDAAELLMYAEPSFSFRESGRRWWSLSR